MVNSHWLYPGRMTYVLNKLLNLTVQASQLLMSRFIVIEINIHIKSQVSKLDINNMLFLHAVKEL